MSIGGISLRMWTMWLAGLMLTAIAATADPSGQNGLDTPKFEFGLIGDVPYDVKQEHQFDHMMQEFDSAHLSFVIHAGDFKSGSTVCSDEVFRNRYRLFDASRHPFIYVPGDNEWTDCHRANNGSYDPIERLNALRAVFFATDQSLGQRTLRLTRQSEDPRYARFVENARWIYGDVVFVTLNIPGSNNNLGRTAAPNAEYVERNAANLEWLRGAFGVARRDSRRGVMITIQANPGFDLAATDPRRTGYNDFLSALQAETAAFDRPVVLVHGDTHYFRVDKPLADAGTGRAIEQFTRVETFGSPNVHWVRGVVDFRDPNLFRFEPVVVQANIY